MGGYVPFYLEQLPISHCGDVYYFALNVSVREIDILNLKSNGPG